jgi:hypothetical protein
MIDLIMLICASIGAMAFGILAAYWILRAGFSIIQPRRSAPVKVQAETASIS